MHDLWTRTLIATLLVLAPVQAHGTTEVGDIQIAFHWQDEPAYAGMPNAIVVEVDAMMKHGHEAYEAAGAPTVAISVVADAMKGHNLFLDVDDFEFAPEDASGEHVDGTGHAHLYIDGAKIGRLYGSTTYLGGLSPGEHTVRVTLNTNDHRDYTVGGVVVADEATFMVPEPTGHNHGDHHHAMEPIDIDTRNAVPEVSIDVVADPMKGYNLHIDADNFRFAPERASTEHRSGEGHAHLYIDGEKIGRVYSEWMYLGASLLPAGTHEVRVTLNGNDHRDYAVDGDIVEDIRIIKVPEPDAMMHPHDPYDVPAGEPQPQLDIELLEDPKKGHNLHLTTQAFEFAPELASTDHVAGKGHAHLFIDGQKVTRLYADWYPIMGLAPGDHTVRVTLNTNSHSDYRVDGEVVADEVTLTVPEPMGDGHMHSHAHSDRIELQSSNEVPRLAMRVEPDAKKGQNLFLDVSGFRFAPERASTDHRAGEGHAHLYIDGEKVTRLYTEATYLSLSPGAHTVRVTLNSNDHRDYRVDGALVAQEATVIVPDQPATGVEGLQYDLDIDVGYGNDTLPLVLQTTDEPGVYKAVFTPMVPGDYTVLLEGEIRGEPVSLNVSMDSVQAMPSLGSPASKASETQDTTAIAQIQPTGQASTAGVGLVGIGASVMLALAGLGTAVVAMVRTRR